MYFKPGFFLTLNKCVVSKVIGNTNRCVIELGASVQWAKGVLIDVIPASEWQLEVT